jgi:hypothetical protein
MQSRYFARFSSEKPSAVQRQRALLLVEDTHYHALAVIERRRRYAEVEVEVLLGELLEDDASILRQPTLGDVEVAHDLDAGDERRPDLFGSRSFSWQMPSMRLRTMTSFSCGSTWMSLVPEK